MTDEERLHLVAVHESGHAILRALTGTPMRHVSIVPDETTLGRVTTRRERQPEVRDHLILGCDPARLERARAEILVLIAGYSAERRERGLAGVSFAAYAPESPDFKRALELAVLFSESTTEGIALLAWLEQRMESIVRNLWFRRIEDRLVPLLLEHAELSEAEVLVIVHEVLDISPKTRRGRLHLRLLRLRSRIRRAFRRIVRR